MWLARCYYKQVASSTKSQWRWCLHARCSGFKPHWWLKGRKETYSISCCVIQLDLTFFVKNFVLFVWIPTHSLHTMQISEQILRLIVSQIKQLMLLPLTGFCWTSPLERGNVFSKVVLAVHPTSTVAMLLVLRLCICNKQYILKMDYHSITKELRLF